MNYATLGIFVFLAVGTYGVHLMDKQPLYDILEGFELFLLGIVGTVACIAINHLAP